MATRVSTPSRRRGLLPVLALALVPAGAFASTLDIGVFQDATTLNATPATPVSRLSDPLSLGASSYGLFDIAVNLTGATTTAISAAFASAEQFWESRILGYRSLAVADEVARDHPSVQIAATIATIDGAGGTLGFAGSTDQVVEFFGDGDPRNSIVSVAGLMTFDVDDINALVTSGRLEETIRHEMAHVLGFSDLFWDFVGAVDGVDTDTSYTGAHALAAYREEFDPGATFVPVEGNYGPGTAFSHWDESLFANNGNERNPELMTGFLDSPTTFSMTTLASFEDIGYATSLVQQPSIIPLPAPVALLVGGLGLLGFAGRRRRGVA